MKEKVGEVFSIAADNPPVPFCTVSRELTSGADGDIAYYSLAENTDISAEMYPYYKLILPSDGEIEIYFNEMRATVGAGDGFFTPTDIPVGIWTKTGSIYTEIMIGRTDKMNQNIHAGEVFSLAGLVPYQEGKIVNMDVVHNDKMKFVIMAFDAGTGLSEHAAPGEALIFALDGEAVIGYEGKEYTVHAGENFHFAKGGRHSVKANSKFKMGLLLCLEA